VPRACRRRRPDLGHRREWDAAAPLSEIEEALLVGAGAGFSGLALWDLPTPAPYRRRSGRTFPTTRPGGNTALFFTNDEGLYVLDANVAASKLREIETPDERTKLLEVYRAQRRELCRGRLEIPRRIPPMSGHDLWDSNRPGSTLFLPVCDVSASLISLIAQFVDPTLRRYASAGGGMNIVDDRHGCRPAGTERWLKDGFLDAERMLPLSIVERQACYYVFSEPAAICQNMFWQPRLWGWADGSTADFSRSKFLSAWASASSQRMAEQHSVIRSGWTACSRHTVRPFTRPWMQQLTRCLRRRYPAARKPGRCRIASRRRSIAPARFV
jgi:hypothetical protein